MLDMWGYVLALAKHNYFTIQNLFLVKICPSDRFLRSTKAKISLEYLLEIVK